ncbi:MAG: hypothetical protein ACRCSP_04460 [Rhodoglobus sp.]
MTGNISSSAAPQRASRRIVRRLRRLSWLRSVVVHPVISRPGFWFVTVCGVVWGGLLGGFTLRREGKLIVASGLPSWAYGRGGMTLGAVYLTRDNTSSAVLEHEDVHRAQWKKYGLAFIPLYVEAGREAQHNRFEIEADLRKGGYGI